MSDRVNVIYFFEPKRSFIKKWKYRFQKELVIVAQWDISDVILVFVEAEINRFNKDTYTEITKSAWLKLKDFDQAIVNNEMSLTTKEKLYENGVYLEIWKKNIIVWP